MNNLEEKDFVYGSNEYGRYAIPKNSMHRPAAQAIINSKIWEKETLQYIKNSISSNSGDIIHAGAYFGDFLPFLSAIIPDNIVWTFEPCEENYISMLETIQINKLHNVVPFNFALGDEDKEVNIQVLDINLKSLGGTSKITTNNDTTLTHKVKQVAIDDIIKGKVILIHLDVENYEEQALRGALNTIRSYSPILIIEDWCNGGSVLHNEWFKKNILELGYSLECKINDNLIFKKT